MKPRLGDTLKSCFLATLLGGIVLVCLEPAEAKARLLNRVEMAQGADVIAVVELTAPKKCSVQGQQWLYTQSASATVLTVVKGKPPASIEIVGGENFECSQTQLHQGRFLAFLRREGSRYRACGWGDSFKPISSKDTVLWYGDDNTTDAKVEVSLSHLIGQLRHQTR